MIAKQFDKTPSGPVGVVLINVGTPRSTSPGDVGRYLRQFLMDPFILDMPYVLRWILVHLIIVPRRRYLSAHAYSQIWTERGSPLLFNSQDLAVAVGKLLGPGFVTKVGMCVGEPSVASALQELKAAGCERVVAVPLFPQYSTAAYEAAAVTVRRAHREIYGPDAPLPVTEPFFANPDFLDAFAERAAEILKSGPADHVLFSYHGLPEQQIRKADDTGTCLKSESCSLKEPPGNPTCYKAQCYATTRELARRLGLGADRHSTSFQSRLGRAAWIRPYTEDQLTALAKKGVKDLVVVSPAFVADCLETLEEIGVRAAESFRQAGGRSLRLVPSLNASPRFAEGVKKLVLAQLS